jgi:transglutaminase-like putative cysteine protease
MQVGKFIVLLLFVVLFLSDVSFAQGVVQFNIQINQNDTSDYLEFLDESGRTDVSEYLRVDKLEDNPWYSLHKISLDIDDYPVLLYEVNELDSLDIVQEAYRYIMNNYYYDEEYAKTSKYAIRDGGHYNVQTLIDTRKGLCGDVSIMYAIILRAFSIPCKIVESDSHVWNEVWHDNRWVIVDCTVSLGAEGRYISYPRRGDDSLYTSVGMVREY